jgi:oxalate decarboxylase/phosphoglucose isomerase-like protein (cupin superfamily)
MVVKKTHKQLEPYLMDVLTKGVDEPYFIIKVDDKSVVVVSPGQNGLEYNKTEGYAISYAGVQLFQCLYGQGVLLLQRNDEEGNAKEFKVVTLNPSKQVTIPSGWVSALVNIGKSFLIILVNPVLEDEFQDRSEIKEKHGLAYYVIEKKGEVSFEQNPNYQHHPQITPE